MVQGIMTSPAGTNSVMFGDEDRRYEILESTDAENPCRHDFEVRVWNDPDSIYLKFSINADPGTSDGQMMGRGIRMARECAARMHGELESPADALPHLQKCLKEAAGRFPAGAVWEKKEDGADARHYECTAGRTSLSLSPSREGGPWRARLGEGRGTVHEEPFYLDGYVIPEDEEEGLTDAQERAFQVMERYIKGRMDYWMYLHNKLLAMKDGKDVP